MIPEIELNEYLSSKKSKKKNYSAPFDYSRVLEYSRQPYKWQTDTVQRLMQPPREGCITISVWLNKYHRLRGSASPVLINGDTSFLWEPRVTFWLFSGSPLEVRPHPQPIYTQNGSDDVDSRKYLTFKAKIAIFHIPWSSGPLNGQNFANFWT